MSLLPSPLSWIDLQTLSLLAGILFGCASLLYNAYESRRNTKATLVSNRLAVTAAHRELSLFRLSHSELARITDPKADVSIFSPSSLESEWLALQFLQFSANFYAIQNKQYERPDRLIEDVRSYLSLPIPRAFWEQVKGMHNKEVVQFIKDCQNADTEEARTKLINSL